MRKWNIGGFALFFIVVSFATFFLGFYPDGNEASFTFPFLFTFIGIVLLGIDRWAGQNRYGIFSISLFWAGYWGIIAFRFFSIAALYAFVLGFGHGDSEVKKIGELHLYGYLGTVVLFGVLALANLVKFFILLFSLPKLKNS